MTRIYKYAITDEDRKNIVEMLLESKCKDPGNPYDNVPDYWERVNKWIEFFSEDVFEEDSVCE